MDYPSRLKPPFGFVFCPHNSVRHLLSAADLRRHLRSVAAVLAPGGAYAVGIGLQRPDDPIQGEDVHRAARGRVKITSVFQYFESPRRGPRGARLERVVSFTTVGSGRRKRLIESAYDLLCVDPVLWQRCVRSAGLAELAVVDDERGKDLPAGRTDYAYRILVHASRGEARTQGRRGS